VHAGGDATGAEVQRALHEAVRRDPWIRLVEHALVLDLLRSAGGRACGLTLHVLGEGAEDGVGAILSRAVVLATGGMGQVYSSTTNPSVSTGDGVALALRAGATVTDVEFVQFHPTSFVSAAVTSVQRPLISEALRGEGAHLVDEAGKRFMVGQHELAELAPRDVVAKGIHRVLRATGADHVYLDARHLGAEFLEHRFPTIVASTRAAGVDPATDLIPVAPAAHYASGGVRTDLAGRTSIPGLYACGEVACTGVHGANRLASNSLLEGLVFAKRIADDIARDLPGQADPVRPATGPAWVADPEVRPELQRAMTRGAGVLRSADSLDTAAKELSRLAAGRATPRNAAWEATNLLTVAAALVAAAQTRRETRGCHWREDYPSAADEWRGHLLHGIDARGRLTQSFGEMA
jgi:L-aspartate oxidase